MYRVYMDDRLLWSPDDNSSKVYRPTLSMELNTVGSFSCKMYPTHPCFDRVVKMKSVIEVRQGDRIIFRGRVYRTSYDFRRVKTIEAEGVMGYFNDSIVAPYEFSGTPEDYLRKLISEHNAQVDPQQRLILGRVTVTDPNNLITRAASDRPTTWSEIHSKLIDKLGGYMVARYEPTGTYIDYLASFTDVSTQKVAFALNILDLTQDSSADTLSTCIIPLGAKDANGDRLTIASVNNGCIYVSDEDAVAAYGKIYEVKEWDDVGSATNLIRKAREYLSTRVTIPDSMTIKIIDLHLSDQTIEAFKLGDLIQMESKPHEIHDTALITAMNIVIDDPQNSTIDVGISKKTYLDEINKNFEKQPAEAVQTITSTETEYYISTSATAPEGGSWLDNPPEFDKNKYLWTRSKTVYANPTAVKYGSPALDPTWCALAGFEVGARNLAAVATSIDGKRIVDGYKYSALYSASDFRTSAQIMCAPGDPFTLSTYAGMILSLGFFDADGFCLSRPTGYKTVASGYSETFYAPVRSAFVAVSWQKSGDGKIKLERGTVKTDYTVPPEDLDAFIVSEIDTASNRLLTDTQSFTSTSIENAKENMTQMMAQYATKTELSQYDTKFSTQISQTAQSFQMNFEKTTETINSINGELTTKIDSINTYVRATVDGMELGSGDADAVKLILRHDSIGFVLNGNEFGYWDGDNFHTGNIFIDVNERAQFGDFAWVPRSDGSLMFLKVAGSVADNTYTEPEIVTEPVASIEGTAGDNYSISFVASGQDIEYCWQYLLGSTWYDMGCAESTMSGVMQIENNGMVMRCIASDVKAHSVTSRDVTMIVGNAYTISMEAVSGASFGFKDIGGGWYQSTNAGYSNSASLIRMVVTTKMAMSIKITYVTYGESYNDFGMISKANTALTTNYTNDGTSSCIFHGRNKSSPDAQTITLEVPAGGTFFDFKYRKNSSVNEGSDSFKFKWEVI